MNHVNTRTRPWPKITTQTRTWTTPETHYTAMNHATTCTRTWTMPQSHYTDTVMDHTRKSPHGHGPRQKFHYTDTAMDHVRKWLHWHGQWTTPDIHYTDTSMDHARKSLHDSNHFRTISCEGSSPSTVTTAGPTSNVQLCIISAWYDSVNEGTHSDAEHVYPCPAGDWV